MDKLRKALSGHDNEEVDSGTGIMNNLTSELNWSSRIKMFAACFILSFILSMLGWFALLMHKMPLFAVLYTLGNIVSLASSCFLMGPMKQLKKMFAQTRIVATIVVICMIVLTFVSALVLQKPGLSFLFIIIQSLAMTWYSLSYVPYARDAVKKTLTSCV